jgi:hypothetical protein
MASNIFDTGLGFAVNVDITQNGWDYAAVGFLRLILGIIIVFLVVHAIKAYFTLEVDGGDTEVREECIGMIKDSFVGLILVVITSSILPNVVSFILRTTGVIY